MTNLSRRLRKLETRVLDASGLIPHSEEWFEYWVAKLDEYIQGGNPDFRGMPLSVIDTLIERTGQEVDAEPCIDDSDGDEASSRLRMNRQIASGGFR
jgi:hypothetical protein